MATLGPASTNPDTLLAMAKAGMDVCRLNFSHADHETHLKSLKMVRKINKDHGANLCLLQDLQGPKIRIGDLKEPVQIKAGQVLTIRSDVKEHKGTVLPIQYETFAADVKVGDPVLIDDGKVECRVIETNSKNRVKIEVVAGDVISSRKGVNLPRTNISIPTITEKDFKDMDFAIEHGVDWVALSFVRSADDVKLLKELIRLKNGVSKVIAKIEKPEALQNLDAIIEASDAIMVARGDLGVEIPMEEVPAWQKRIVQKCNQAGKPVIVATHVMESMITSPRPTRAEANDVANALVDGADAVMLSGETSVGKYPVRTVTSMAAILESVENQEEHIYYRNMTHIDSDESELASAIINTACKLSQETDAAALLAMTRSGFTALRLSRCRPKARIYAFTNNRSLMTTMSLVWGIRVFFYDNDTSTDDTIQDVHEMLKERGLVKPGDVMINTGSMPLHEHGLTNMIKVSRVRSKGNVRN